MISLLILVFPMVILGFNRTNSSNENPCFRSQNQTLAKRGNMCSQATAETVPDVLPVEQRFLFIINCGADMSDEKCQLAK